MHQTLSELENWPTKTVDDSSNADRHAIYNLTERVPVFPWSKQHLWYCKDRRCSCKSDPRGHIIRIREAQEERNLRLPALPLSGIFLERQPASREGQMCTQKDQRALQEKPNPPSTPQQPHGHLKRGTIPRRGAFKGLQRPPPAEARIQIIQLVRLTGSKRHRASDDWEASLSDILERMPRRRLFLLEGASV